ncbi:MAG TPA: DUF3823 domain-containing protein [Chitinophagaceae bacterium]|jgi:hypothetical protein|nr:DUF3823 domain-containing protein [Chitinophagaceae bacterium]
MKSKFLTLASIAAVLVFSGCKKDNYEAPTSTISGRIVNQGSPIGVRSDGVQLELWQPGFAFFNKLPVYVKWDGTFSVKTFDGNYKLTRLRGNGPWADNTDTINIELRGNAVVDVPVDPYFVIKGETFARTANTINATLNLQRINTTRALEEVRLYIGGTTILDQVRNDRVVSKAANTINIAQPITISGDIPAAVAAKGYVYVRLGVKTVGVAELLYSQPQLISLK